MDKYGDYLYSFALYRIQDESTAQDLVQDTLTAALTAKDRYKGKSSEKTWLTSILKHKILDFIRKKYREPVFEEDHFNFQNISNQFDSNGKWKTGPASWAVDPEKLLEQKSFLTLVKKCLKEIPRRPATALALKEVQGETTQAICKVLDISTTNCWVILHRARALMRTCIEKKWTDKRE